MRMKPYLVLGMETSCDETSAAVVAEGRTVLSNVIASQIDLHAAYGGVVPELASRKHVELVLPVLDQALREAGVALADLDGVAVTHGPGLVGALLVGVSAAKAVAFAAGKPLVGVHHIEGHIAANYLAFPDLEPPFLALVASGGHSHLIGVDNPTKHLVLGRTRDDAAGEAFDKVARVLGLGYPGGPAIDRMAGQGNPEAFSFPRVHFADAPFDFSFSGLKTAVIQLVNTLQRRGDALPVADLCASFQQAVVDVLVDKTIRAAQAHGYGTVCLAGGVASNRALRVTLEQRGHAAGLRILFPPAILCTDNAAMIACMGTFLLRQGMRSGLDLNAVPTLHMTSLSGA
jgi:N6-L-threonylcarbamoyladenine synthase